MKKLLTLVSSLFLVSIISAKAEMGIGVSGAYHMFKADGTETTRTSNQQNNGSHDEDVAVPEIFIEPASQFFTPFFFFSLEIKRDPTLFFLRFLKGLTILPWKINVLQP